MLEGTPMEKFWLELKPYVVSVDSEIAYRTWVHVRAPAGLIMKLGRFRKFEIIETDFDEAHSDENSDNPFDNAIDDALLVDWANAWYRESAPLLRKVGILTAEDS